MEIGKRLQELRSRNNMTQEDMAKLCHVTRQTISNWEIGKRYPDLESLVLISEHFNISLDALLKDDSRMLVSMSRYQRAYFRYKRNIAVLGALLVICILIIIDLKVFINAVEPIDLKDYTVTVQKMEPEDISILEKPDKTKYAVWESPVVSEESGKKDRYVIEDSDYDDMKEYGNPCYIKIVSKEPIDEYHCGKFNDKNGNMLENELEISIKKRKNVCFDNPDYTYETMWPGDISKIYAQGKDNKRAIVWEKK